MQISTIRFPPSKSRNLRNINKVSQQSFDMFYWLLLDVCKVYCEDKSLVAAEIFFLQ